MSKHTLTTASLSMRMMFAVLCICALPAAAATTTDCMPPTAIADAPEPAWRVALSDVLVAPDRATRLLRALSQVPDEAAADLLVARAQRVQAALFLNAKKFDAARALLLTMPMDAPEAWQGALLLAEADALAGDLPAALRWNQRALQRWPQQPEVLAALIARAQAVLLDGLPAASPQAVAALTAAVADARAGADQLTSLRLRLAEGGWFDRWLAGGAVVDLDQELLPVFYRTVASNQFSRAYGTVQATDRQQGCAQAQRARLHSLRDDVRRAIADAPGAQAALVRDITDAENRFAAEEQAYRAAAVRDPAQGAALNRLRNQLTRLRAEQAVLASMQAGLPAALARLEAHLDQLAAATHQLNAGARAEVLQALHAALDERRNRLLDLAGEASLALAEWQDPRYRRLLREDGAAGQ